LPQQQQVLATVSCLSAAKVLKPREKSYTENLHKGYNEASSTMGDPVLIGNWPSEN